MKIAPDLVASLGARAHRHPRERHQRQDDDHVDDRGRLGRTGHDERDRRQHAGRPRRGARRSPRASTSPSKSTRRGSPTRLASTRPRVVVLLNLSRDQMDRANEVRHLAERWRKALEAHDDDELVVVANANDPLVVYAAEVRAKRVWADVPTSWLADALSCPKCTLAISHVGNAWHCTCGFAKPAQRHDDRSVTSWSSTATTVELELVDAR